MREDYFGVNPSPVKVVLYLFLMALVAFVAIPVVEFYDKVSTKG